MNDLKKRISKSWNLFLNKSDTIGYIILALLFVYIHVRIWNNLEAMIESDMSSELVLSQILAKEKRIITLNWFYATELKVLHNTLLYSFLFLLFNDWHLIRIISIAVLNLFLLASFFYLAKKLKIKNQPWIAIMIIGSTSRDYFKFVTLGSHYIPDLVISFITIGLLFDILEENSLTKKNIKLMLLMVLSFLSSLSGIRFFAVLHLPLLLMAIIYCFIKQYNDIKNGKINFKDKNISFVLICFFALVFSYLGVYMNSNVLPELGYTYKTDGTDVQYLEFSFKSLSIIFNGWLNVFGYQADGLPVLSIDQIILKPLFVVYFIINIYSTIHVLMNYKKYDEKEFLITIFYIVGIVLLTGLYCFTSTWYKNRYLLSISVFSVFIIGIFFTHYKIEWQKWFMLLAISAFVLYNTMFQISFHLKNDSYIELATVRDILLENECYNGYSLDHWNGNNILTELSDGKIETWYGSPNNVYEYQQAKNHIKSTPTNKVYGLLLKTEMDQVKFKKDSNKYKYYEDDVRVLYIFDSLNEMKNVMDW